MSAVGRCFLAKSVTYNLCNSADGGRLLICLMHPDFSKLLRAAYNDGRLSGVDVEGGMECPFDDERPMLRAAWITGFTGGREYARAKRAQSTRGTC